MSNIGDTSGNDDLNEAIRLSKELEEIHEFNKKINSDFTGFITAKKQLLDLEENIRARTKIVQEQEAKGNGDVVKFLKQKLDYDKQTLALQQQQLKNANLFKVGLNSLVNTSMAGLSTILGDVVEYINKADGAFKELNKTIGLSGDRSGILRDNLVGASQYAASLGIDFENLAKIQGSYTSEFGNAVLLSKESLQNISQIAAGTQMGAEQAGTMAAKFANMGKSVSDIRQFYEDTINQSAKFGVSADVVIKKINDNLDKSQKYVFKGGVAGLRDMAMYATKFNIDMNSVFNAMDKSNSLEGAVDMVAQLQVLGGKFAQNDPFKLLFDSRNDAVAFTHDIENMTRGMATFNKTSGEIQITAGDLNRLKLAADATGISYEDLIKQAKRGKEINMIDSMISPNMTKDQRAFIEGAAELQKGGSFTISMPDGTSQDIRNLTGTQIDAIKQSNTTLEEQAKNAMTFDKLIINTMNELKSSLLPVLRVIDSVLEKINGPFLKGALEFGAASLALGSIVGGLRQVSGLLSIVAPSIKNIGGIGGRLLGNTAQSVATSAEGATMNAMTGVGESANGLGKGITESGEAAGGAWKNMLAFGAAVAGVGAGIFLATEGIAGMANAFKGLNGTQIAGVVGSLTVLGVAMGSIIALAPGLGMAAPELVAFGVGVALIGGGIGIAAAGIGFMAKGFGDLFESIAKVANPQVTENLGRLMLSLGGLSTEALLFANPLTWIGLKALSVGLDDIGDKLKDANFENLALGATSFDGIATAIDRINEKKLDKLIEVSESLGSIGSIAALFGNLASSLGDGIEVKFNKDKVNLEVNVTAEMDGEKVGRMISKDVALSIERSSRGSVK